MTQEKTLTDQVTNWLDTQGYPLEMKVASKLRKSGFGVRHSVHYSDPETLKSREIDVICKINEPIGLANIYFTIECKSTKKPWVMFTSEHTLQNYNHLFALAIMSDKARLELGENIFNLQDSLLWFSKKGRIGYSLTQAFSDGQDTPYEATMSAIKASLSLYKENDSSTTLILPFFFAFPIVVTASPLFECYFDESGGMKVQEIQEGFLFFDGKIGNFQGTCLRIVTENAIDSLANEIKETSESLMGLLKNSIDREVSIMKSSNPSN
jgi:hypothetical protein